MMTRGCTKRGGSGKRAFILCAVLGFSLFVCLLDAVFQPNYFLKITIKFVLFLAIPTAFLLLYKEERRDFQAMFALKHAELWKPLLLCAGIYGGILGGYILTASVIDYSNVTVSLTEGMGITADNFLWVALYISLLNSFLEELLFRGLGFIALKKQIGRQGAHLLSAALFAFYHVGMLLGMFTLPVLVLLLAGLMVGGWIFNRLNECIGSIYPSWLVHMSANFAINTVGCLLFGLLP